MQLMTASRAEAEKVYIVVKNNEGDALTPGRTCEFTLTTTDADQGYLVELVDTAVNATIGISAPLAGVVETTISTGSVGRLQVYGPCNVRASASYQAGTMVVASSAIAAGDCETAIVTTAFGPGYTRAILGHLLENGPNATNATIFLKCL